MKKIKKLLMIMLVAVMTLTFTKTAFAAGNGEITITNPNENETYSIYKIFDLESYDTENETYSYKVVEDWEDFFGAGKDQITLDKDGYITGGTLTQKDDDAAEVVAFAKAALEYAKVKNIEPITKEATTNNLTDGKLVFSDLDLGYYLVDTTLGTLCSLDTTDATAEIAEKNNLPDLTKTVKEDNEFVSANDAKIGDVVEFKIVVDAKPGAQNYVVHDNMEAGLTFNANSVVVKFGEDTLVGTGDNKNYTLTTGGTDTFTITFAQNFLDTIEDNTKDIIITYNATLNTGAAIISKNSNKAYLTYGQNSDNQTETSTTNTYTWKFQTFKFTGSPKKALAGAKFVLSTGSTTANAISFVQVSDTVIEAQSIPTYRVAVTGETGITEITTDTTGLFILQGLDSGDYYLIETAAPTGYNKLTEPVVVTISSEIVENTTNQLEMELAQDEETADEIEVENNTGSLLPSTGGMGTKIFLAVGTLLFFTTAIVLVAKKRMYNEA